MNKLLRAGLYTVYAIGLLLIALTAGSKYDWMTEMDPSIPSGAIEDGSGRSIFSGLLLGIVILIQTVLMATTKNKAEKLMSVTLMALAVVVWVLSR